MSNTIAASTQVDNLNSLNIKDCVYIPDDFEGYSPSMFNVPRHYEDYIGDILIPVGLIKDRIEKLAGDIFKDLNSENGFVELSAVCILKGGYRFFSDLLDNLNALNTTSGRSIQLSIDFIKVKSYVDDGKGAMKSGDVNIIGMANVEKSLKGKHVLIVEDMLDTGRTMQSLLKTVAKLEPKSVKVACLLRKRTPLSDDFKPDYVGFEIPNKYLVGYALDYNEYFRDLSHICVINNAGIDKYKKK